MSLRSSLTHRLAIATTVGTLAVATMAAPAIADDDWNGQGGQTSGNDGNWNQGGGNQAGSNQTGSNQAGSNQSGSNQAGSNQTGSNQSGGNQTGSNQSGGNQTGSNQAGSNWNQTGNDNGYDNGGNSGTGTGTGSNTNENANNSNSNSNSTQSLYKGRVTASTLALRARPDRGGQIIRYAHKGEIVSIFCKTGGETVDGNPLWYLLTDGTWAWGAARYIDNVGSAPRWC
ncbi:SH3 domain-containing protein [Streptomyces sp. NBC_01231]|nr:SH3 domain-containing protein [Streptomyces sp. NBC_01231]